KGLVANRPVTAIPATAGFLLHAIRISLDTGRVGKTGETRHLAVMSGTGLMNIHTTRTDKPDT
ncbi:hypothetical protein LH462_11395, partial [Laribacter hongkongensis]|uniref:hypothetical protein n=1 Tax=Laribacter hongkongensis TaxID=168471 RepID=UPI001EFD01BA